MREFIEIITKSGVELQISLSRERRTKIWRKKAHFPLEPVVPREIYK
jgi:hypothetical protein